MAKISPVVWWAVNFVQGDTRGTCMPMGLMLLPVSGSLTSALVWMVCRASCIPLLSPAA